MAHTIRAAGPADVPVILGFIRDLAEYEKLSHEVEATEAQLSATLFGPKPAAECILACIDDEPAGFGIFFTTYSTFLAKPGLHLEDLFVKKEFRGRGIGKAILTHLAALAIERNYGRMEWTVLDWNRPAIDFYHSLGAQQLHEWRICRLTGSALTRYQKSAS